MTTKTNKIKILYIIDKLVPAGTQTNILEIVRNLDKNKFEPHVIALLEGGELFDEFVQCGVTPILLNVKRAYGLSGMKALGFMWKFMKRKKIDIVQNHFLHADILGTAAARLAGVKKVISTRRDEGFWRSYRQLLINRMMNCFNDGILVNSYAVQRAVLSNEKVHPKKIEVIYNGISESRFVSDDAERQQIRSEMGIAKDEIIIGSVGNMRHTIKGQHYLIKAMSYVIKQNDKAKLVLVGDGELRKQYEDLAVKMGINDKVIFYGSSRKIPALMNAFDIFCLPSLTEGFSNSLLEAMLSEKPVVATNVGGNPEIIKEGVTGFLVPAQDSANIGYCLVKLANNKEITAEFGKQARKRALSLFSLKRMITEHENVYSRLFLDKNEKSFHRPNPKKVCHLIWALEAGGAERQVVNIATWQKNSGYEPSVICLTKKGLFADELENLGIPVQLIKKNRGLDFSIIGKLSRYLVENHIGVLHTHVPTANLWGRLAARKAGIKKVFVSEHSALSATDFKFRMINKLLTRWTAKYIVVSEDIKKAMVLGGIKREKIEVVHNGICLNGKQSKAKPTVRTSLGIEDSHKIVGTIGRLEYRKDYSTFLKACAKIKVDVPDTKFVIAGDGPLRSELVSEAKDLGLEKNVEFLGTRLDVDNVMVSMDVFVLSSLTEGISISLLEAMSHGKPCVVTNVGGNPEVIKEGINGKLVPKQDAGSLATAIKDLIQSPQAAGDLAREAKKTVEQDFSLEAMMTKMERVYKQEIRNTGQETEKRETL